MSRQIQIRRGTAAQHDSFTGAIGEVTMDTTHNTLRVHDGVTPGGNEVMLMKKFYSNITNCVTEIPQDINLELTDGTLTLKAGSKVYDGNGLYATITTDLDFSWTGTGTKMVISVLANGSALNISYMGTSVSSLPAATSSYELYYNTTDGKCYYDNGAWVETSFPIALVSAVGQISAIDKVFNGFGYVGSTIFALPGIKGLIPNGRNTDGSLKSIEYSLPSVATIDTTSISSGYRQVILKNDGLLECCTSLALSPDNYLLCNGSTIKQGFAIVSFGKNSSKINVFNKQEVFHAINCTSTEFLAHQMTPSNEYIDLTLGDAGTIYVAPADGYVLLDANATTVYGYIILGGSNCPVSCMANRGSTGTNYLACTLPLSKGMSFGVWYQDISLNRFRFVYAGGTK